WRPNAKSKTQDYPTAPLMMANGVGGSAVHYTAMGWRFREDDFKIRSSTIDAYGEEAIPEGNDIIDWPLSYEELEPYYHKAEVLVGTSGVSGANPFESPRKHDYPMPPLQRTGYGELM